MKLADFFADIYKPKRLFDRSPETTRLYNVSIRSFDKTLGRASTLKDLTDANLRRHMERVVTNGRSKATANKDRAQLLAIWRLAFSMRMVETSPDVQAYKEPERSPVAWLATDLERIFAAIDKTAGHFGTIPQDIWWKALVRVALETGERIGALVACRWDWLHDDWLFIPAEVRKGSRSDRSYRLSPEAVAILAEMRSKRQPGELIFHWPYSYNYLWTKYKAILNAAKLPSGRRDMFHKHRRTTGSVAYAAGLDPQDVLDHQYRRTTQRYLDKRFTREKQPCDILAAYLANPSPPLPPDATRQTG